MKYSGISLRYSKRKSRVERFNFRLENVLRLKKKIEENRKHEFSKRSAELFRLEQEMSRKKQKLHEFMNENSYSEGVFTALDIITVDRYITRVQNHLEGLSILREGKKREVQSSLDILKEAKKQRKTIETLKQRLIDRYLLELNREEARELDDINGHIAMNRERLTIEDLPLEET
ncbi:MAG TPA: flagellar export protein FliJ [Spirochaetota bacterium]|nr:flagellar export protein FliJ [Spirochaetota bacterium]